ncbi:MAG: cell wall hydrolase [Candidatus Devosia phytovorans]|uniref:Cell wall hydrolase n=1 Tax=Candidatus Devosia phytovorans TaxID=3121372 RepID=A0AAJ5VUR1_9HYPH|nr:cell wall hydrolase [Devosia sp.]WEK03828.1 MAG: cell wall hydrolase [Devosia sp.]
MRAFSHVLALGAIALVLFITLVPAHAQTLRVADVTPFEVPADLITLREQPAIGPTFVGMAPGQQALTPALLANYVDRQNKLRALDVLGLQEQEELTADVLMGYIARGSMGEGNSAVSAIASFAAPTAAIEPDLNPTMLAAYVETGYQPLAARLQHADAERDCLAQAIYHEARGESQAGQLAVANVIVNRARSGKFPSTLCGVIYQNADKGYHRCQFTFACDGRNDAPGERNAWKRSAELAQSVYAEFALGDDVGAVPGSALYYHTTAVNPSWSNTYNAVAEIGSHIFYSPN